MSSAVKCQACGSFFNGAVYAKCPYCGNGNTEKKSAPEKPAAEEAEKKKKGIKFPPFITGKRNTEKKEYSANYDCGCFLGSRGNDNTSDIDKDDFQKTDILRPGEKGGQKKETSDKKSEKRISGSSMIMDSTVGLWELDSSGKDAYELRAEKKEYSAPPVSGKPVPSATSGNSLSNAISRSGKTVGKYISNSTGESIAPVVGWLIGVKGADYGRSYNLKSGKNKIGRSVEMDIALEEESVSRSSVAVIVYDSKQKEFSLLSGESDSLCFLNGSALYDRQVLSSGDELEFGDSELNKYVFIPLCGDGFGWDKYPIK